ncbi:MAG: PHP domain-containing protein [Clostridia bacterium]|nr:PHP domain-containing protein [Clostridia bacterium]
MFKTETHLHVSEVSRCSHLTAAEMVEYYRAAGYTTLIVTDHFSQHTMEHWGSSSVISHLDIQFRGYEAAKKAAEGTELRILCGTEISLNTTPNHYLLYGFTKDFFAREDLLELTPEELYAYAKEHGVYMVQAHPYRDEKCHPTFDCVDAVEGYNSNPRHENFSNRTVALAKEYGKPITSGSDAHRPEDVAGGGVITEAPIETIEDYITALQTGKFQPIK